MALKHGTLLRSHAVALEIFERTILRKIFSPVCVSDNFSSRTNKELLDIQNDLNVVQCINIQCLSWLGHIVRMEENAPAREILNGRIGGHRQRGRPCLCWNLFHCSVSTNGAGVLVVEEPNRKCLKQSEIELTDCEGHIEIYGYLLTVKEF